MATPIVNLDDRRFDDLVDEAKTRLLGHLPELTQVAPGDPAHAIIDLFAWMTETVIYRANLIPERQRQAFLNLLQIQRRPALPATGIVSVDSAERTLPPLLPAETAFKAGRVTFTSSGELQPLPLSLAVMSKQRMSAEDLGELGLTLQHLQAAYPLDGNKPDPFHPVLWLHEEGPLDLGETLDGSAYLAVSVHAKVRYTRSNLKALQQALAGRTLNIGIAPFESDDGDAATRPEPRRLNWELFWQSQSGESHYLPFEQLHDSSDGARRAGVVRLRLPKDPTLLDPHLPEDPAHAGIGVTPPSAPASVRTDRLLFWLRLSCPEQPGLRLGYLGINALEVVGQGVVRDVILGIGDGRPNQRVKLPHSDVDADSLQLEVEAAGKFETWEAVPHFVAVAPTRKAYVVSSADSEVRFGVDARPGVGKRIRAAYYRHGGGSAGNLPSGSIKSLEVARPGLSVRHEWPTSGGVDAETVDAAERRIPAFLQHRNRAVTARDFVTLAEFNPISAVARAEAVPGFLPGASLAVARRDIPGVVSVFVMPPAEPALGSAPQPSVGLLKDVYQYLSARTLLGTELYVLSPEFVDVAISLSIQEVDPRERQTVLLAVERVLLEHLWALAPGGVNGTGWALGRAIEVDELRTVAGRVAGVRSVGVAHLYYIAKDSGKWQRLKGGQALPLEAYQLPRLVSIKAQPGTGSSAPEPPPGVTPDRPKPSEPAPTPAPVIPDLC